jgi:dipeptidyl aminopeptidase/acylaminoacyl peptidase
MRHALTDAHKPVTLVELNGEDHFLSKAPTRIQAVESAVAFVQQNNPAD